jgi:hypothetical protein
MIDGTLKARLEDKRIAELEQRCAQLEQEKRIAQDAADGYLQQLKDARNQIYNLRHKAAA